MTVSITHRHFRASLGESIRKSLEENYKLGDYVAVTMPLQMLADIDIPVDSLAYCEWLSEHKLRQRSLNRKKQQVTLILQW